ncbi:integrase catalytic domain-containing protein [Trichonephila clavipes]|nr:integrase catalytic domain-containing protein [Trichonephila clavipes]
MVQKQVFLAEIKSLQSKGVVSPNSKLRHLNPFIDSDRLLRVGGRLSNSDLPYVNKHPAILPGNHNLTVQITVHFHRKNLHTGASSLLHYPTPCYLSQLMGNLPRDRVVPYYPFNCSGVDCSGPFMIRTDQSQLENSKDRHIHQNTRRSYFTTDKRLHIGSLLVRQPARSVLLTSVCTSLEKMVTPKYLGVPPVDGDRLNAYLCSWETFNSTSPTANKQSCVGTTRKLTVIIHSSLKIRYSTWRDDANSA